MSCVQLPEMTSFWWKRLQIPKRMRLKPLAVSASPGRRSWRPRRGEPQLPVQQLPQPQAPLQQLGKKRCQQLAPSHDFPPASKLSKQRSWQGRLAAAAGLLLWLPQLMRWRQKKTSRAWHWPPRCRWGRKTRPGRGKILNVQGKSNKPPSSLYLSSFLPVALNKVLHSRCHFKP